MAMIHNALALAARGLQVFPCWPGTKKPRTAHGCKDATIDPLIISDWWTAEPELNIAVATGAASKVFVIDVDSEDGELELRKLEAEHTELPATVEVITGRGRHLWFQYPERPVKNTASKIGPGIDTRADGGYVMAPPSLHPSGKRYAWSVDSALSFAAAPGWLIDRIAAPANGGPSTPSSEWRELVATGVGEGARDCTVTRLAGHLLRRRVDPFVVLELMQIWNTARCFPPLPAADIHRIVDSVCGLELKRRGQ
jgi:Bifunctional DNA primase/polymerase, N-terminal/Primase C terminal 1 (PriCT-1)